MQPRSTQDGARPKHLGTLTALAIVLVAVAGCSDQSTSSATGPTAGPAASAQMMANAHAAGGQNALREGALYVAELVPLNPRVQNQLDPDPRTPRGVAQGKAYFRVVNGDLQAVVDVAGAEPADAAFPEGLHPQHIHAADQCPTMADDVNGDGIVDVIEGLPKYGPIMIPLDNNLADTSSQIPGFPLATGDRGTYHYTSSAPVAAIEAALGHPLGLATRHVVIHGVDLATPLPSSVKSLPGLPAQITLPIACGELREVS